MMNGKDYSNQRASKELIPLDQLDPAVAEAIKRDCPNATHVRTVTVEVNGYRRQKMYPVIDLQKLRPKPATEKGETPNL